MPHKLSLDWTDIVDVLAIHFERLVDLEQIILDSLLRSQYLSFLQQTNVVLKIDFLQRYICLKHGELILLEGHGTCTIVGLVRVPIRQWLLVLGWCLDNAAGVAAYGLTHISLNDKYYSSRFFGCINNDNVREQREMYTRLLIRN